MDLSDIVEREVRKRFDRRHAQIVLSALRSAPLPMLDGEDRARDRARVHLAIVRLSNADLNEFARLLNDAQRDWRDLLVAAGLSGVDWVQVLRRSGYEAP